MSKECFSDIASFLLFLYPYISRNHPLNSQKKLTPPTIQKDIFNQYNYVAA